MKAHILAAPDWIASQGAPGASVVEFLAAAGYGRSSPCASATSVMDAITALFQTETEREALHVQHRIATFGEWMRKRRMEANLTQEEVARLAKVSRTTVANLEAGLLPGGPRLGTAIKLLRVCGKSLEFHADDLSEEDTAVLQAKRVLAGAPRHVGENPTPAQDSAVVNLIGAIGRQMDGNDVGRGLPGVDGGVRTGGDANSGLKRSRKSVSRKSAACFAEDNSG